MTGSTSYLNSRSCSKKGSHIECLVSRFSGENVGIYSIFIVMLKNLWHLGIFYSHDLDKIFRYDT